MARPPVRLPPEATQAVEATETTQALKTVG
jgi:hypothetical protein